MVTKRRTSETLDMLLMSILNTGGKMSGYEIANILRPPVTLIGSVKHSQIYPALARLEQEGRIDGVWIEQRGKPDKRVYTISGHGAKCLSDWLREEGGTFSEEKIVLIAYNIAIVGEAYVRSALSAYRRQCQDELNLLEERWNRAIGIGAEHGTQLDVNNPIWIGVRTSYEFAVSTRAARIAWCDTALDRSEAVIAVAMVRDRTPSAPGLK